ncbi:MAG: 30S ribosomal protein S2 [Chitinispirillia bacterium]|nr:30S ribosomal protein S2 [Chitinispirillia bacterium]MCL2268119.1 30S ribosomal protein S2 [Chitinispirillia bacterium]
MSSLTLPELLDAGTHFGHQTKRWNPKMKRFILCPKNGIYIIDLNKTIVTLDKFIERVKNEVKKGGKVLFVGTKKQLRDCIREEATRCGMPYVTERWLGGMLTNFQTLKQSIAKLDKIEKMEADGTIEMLPKKERLLIAKKKEKLLAILTGIRHMRRLPSIIFVVDTIKEHIAIAEGKRLGIPIGAIVDTNCDPDVVDYPIPGNDDAIKSVQLITRAISDVILENAVASAAAEEMAAKDEPEGASEEESSGASGSGDDGKAKRHRVVHKKIAKVVTPEEDD